MLQRRPHSSLTARSIPQTSHSHSTPPKQYRIPQQEVYNHVRNSVQQTFKPSSNRNYEAIKEYTEATGIQDEKTKAELNRLCKKYSILKQNRRPSFYEGDPINVDFIASRYVKSKSKEKQKEEVKKRLKRDISSYYRYGLKPEYQKTEDFFSLQDQGVLELESRQRKRQYMAKNDKEKGENQKKSHPYLKIYHEVQEQTFNNIFSERNTSKIDPGFVFQQLQEDEKMNENLEQLFKRQNIRKQRRRNVRTTSRKQRSSNKKVQFFLT